jgi:7-carboxy-7-deazaguanine synthase
MQIASFSAHPALPDYAFIGYTSCMLQQIKINEIFYSIQGESSWSGFPTVFVRTSGCHLRCDYCDTTYAYHDGSMMAVTEVLQKVAATSAKYVCVTGGEPLLQPAIYELLKQLCDIGYRVSLETSGDIACGKVDRRVKKIIDVKTPDSGEPDAFCLENLHFVDGDTEFKFVICSEGDFFWAEDFARQKGLFEKSNVLYSPSFGKIEEKWLAQKILGEKSSARLQLQLHKYIWSPYAKGV